MARPYDPREDAAAQAFANLPEEWQTDPFVQNMYQEIMNPDTNWSSAHDRFYEMQDYIRVNYGEDFDAYFDWGAWREFMKAHS